MYAIRTRTSRRGRHAAVAVLAGLLLVVTACASDDTPAAPDDDVDQTAPEPEPSPDPAPEPEPVDDEREGRTTVSVFFPLDGDGDPCEDVSAVPREVAAEDPIGESLVALLEGPTAEELEQGYGGWFSDETAGMLTGYRAEGDVMYVDLVDLSSIIPNASTSCGSALLFAQLDSTLGQFPEVGEPRYSFDGDVDAFYEWLQMGSPEDA